MPLNPKGRDVRPTAVKNQIPSLQDQSLLDTHLTHTMVPAEGNNDDEEIALLFGDAVNPQEDEAAGQLRSRKEHFTRLDEPLPATSEHERLRGDACTQRRPNMQCLAVFLLRATIVSLAFGVVWYSYELFTMGTDPKWIVWFSAGAFVILGFPISMYGILGHLTQYNCPRTQVYVVRILWMVPIYSITSWLAMRWIEYAVLFETVRDAYESYVLYSFLQFLIQVLGGEESLICLLKDKSPTRGFHMWGLQWFMEPWLMGQPMRRANDHVVQWESPFFRSCKLGVLQYVLIKLLCAAAILIMEGKDVYKEGTFSWQSGYLYVCIVTNISQCWALYCMIFFYYATKTELGPIRPVGKFLAVKALVFFTWWQAVSVSVLVQVDMIKDYDEKTNGEAVAKVIQNYLICIEMFLAAVVHTVVFPHSEYSMAAVRARASALQRTIPFPQQKRLGRAGRKRRSLSESTNQDSIEMLSLGELSEGEPTEDRPGFLGALWDSAWPSDLQENTVNLIRGEYRFASKTLLHHAVTSDTYDLFSRIKDNDSH